MPNLNVILGIQVLPPKCGGLFFFLCAPHVCALHMTNSWTLTGKGAFSSEESWEAGSLLILRMFWYFRLDLRWTIQASGKYRADCKILALLLQGITWACLGASLKALNAFHPAAMPLFPGAGLSVKWASLKRKIRNFTNLGHMSGSYTFMHNKIKGNSRQTEQQRVQYKTNWSQWKIALLRQSKLIKHKIKDKTANDTEEGLGCLRRYWGHVLSNIYRLWAIMEQFKLKTSWF